MLRIGLVQMRCPKGEVAQNLASIHACLQEAAARGGDILCFPEMSITGYIDPARRPDAVLHLDSPAVAQFVEMSGETGVTVLAGIVEANPAGKPLITQLVAAGGHLLGAYRTVTIDAEEAAWFAPGAAVTVLSHPTGLFGTAICADINNPSVFAENARRGARIVFAAAAPGLYGSQEGRDWQSGFAWWRGECHTQLGGSAREHGIYLAVATQAGRTVDEEVPGGGYIFAPDGSCIAETADGSPGVLYATLPLG